MNPARNRRRLSRRGESARAPLTVRLDGREPTDRCMNEAAEILVTSVFAGNSKSYTSAATQTTVPLLLAIDPSRDESPDGLGACDRSARFPNKIPPRRKFLSKENVHADLECRRDFLFSRRDKIL